MSADELAWKKIPPITIDDVDQKHWSEGTTYNASKLARAWSEVSGERGGRGARGAGRT